MTTKNEPESSTDDLRDEYDFSTLPGGVRGKYYERAKEGTNLVLLDPDVASAFPTSQAVNEALRTLLRVAASEAKSEES